MAMTKDINKIPIHVKVEKVITPNKKIVMVIEGIITGTRTRICVRKKSIFLPIY